MKYKFLPLLFALSCGTPPAPPPDLASPDMATNNQPAPGPGQLFAAYRVLRQDDPVVGRAFHREGLNIQVFREYQGTYRIDIPNAAGGFPIVSTTATRMGVCYGSQIIETEGAMVLFVQCLNMATKGDVGGPALMDAVFTVTVFK